MSNPQQPRWLYVVGGLSGFVVTSMVMGFVSGALSYLGVKAHERRLRESVPLVPLVVATVDLTAGTALTYDQVSQRATDARLSNEDVVRPDTVNLAIGQPLTVPVSAGETLRWSALGVAIDKVPQETLELSQKACVAAATEAHQLPPSAPELRRQLLGGTP